MSWLISEWQFVLRRSLANWRLLSTIMVGVLIASTLLAVVPFYSNTIDDQGLEHALDSRPLVFFDPHVFATKYDITYENLDTAEQILDRQIPDTLNEITRKRTRWVQTELLTLNNGPGWNSHMNSLPGMEDYITIIEGELAAPTTFGTSDAELFDPDYAIEGMVSPEMAHRFGFALGDVITVGPVPVRLVAFIEPKDIEEEFWFGNYNMFRPVQDPESGNWTGPVLIPEQTMFEALHRYYSEITAQYHWLYYIDREKFTSPMIGDVLAALEDFGKQLSGVLPRVDVLSDLNAELRNYNTKQMYTRIPLFLIVSQIVIIILYYLITVSSMLIERQGEEIALLRSRGASTRQIIGIFFSEGLVLCVFGAAAGPFLGAFIFSLLGRTEAFSALSGGGLLTPRFTGEVFLLAGAGAAMCLFALLVPALQAARRGIVHHRQQASRPARKPFWQRYYLDIVLLILGGVLYWELEERGSLAATDVLGETAMDPLLLIAPILLLAAAGIIFQRIFPLLIRIATGLSRYIRSTPVVLGLWYMARNPVHYGRLILLLIMATAVGMFSATFLGTLDDSYHDRAFYQAGANVRLEGLRSWETSFIKTEERAAGTEGVEDFSMAFRDENCRVGTQFSETRFEILAIDPESFARVAWYRDDFSETSFEELMALLRENAPLEDEGLAIPEGSETLGVWVRPGDSDPEIEVGAIIRDAEGIYREFDFPEIEAPGWHYLETSLIENPYGTPVPPLRLISLNARSTSSGISMRTAWFDDLQVTGDFSSGSTVIIEDFEDISEWSLIEENLTVTTSLGASKTVLEPEGDTVYRGSGSARLNWSGIKGYMEKDFYPNLDDRPLTVIASRGFNAKVEGAGRREIKVRIPELSIDMSEANNIVVADVVDYFPTLDPEESLFVIANIDRLSAMASRVHAGRVSASEMWLTVTEEPATREAAFVELGKLQSVGHKLFDAPAIAEAYRTDPLAGAGWSGILVIAFLGVIIVSSLGFTVYSYLSARARQLDFAILRTQGFSLNQIIGLVGFEQFFIILCGMGIGTLLGGQLSTVMLPFLQLTEKGDRVLPSFILTLDWGTVGIAYLVIGLAFLVTISLVIYFYSKTGIARTLRMGDL